MLTREKALSEIQRRRESEAYRYFIPNGRQEAFIRQFGAAGNFVDIFSGGNGSGKTFVMVNILANLIWGPASPWFDYPLFRNWPFPKKIRIGTTSENFKESGSIDDAINTYWPKGKFEGVKGGRPSISQYRTSTGWTVDKMSFEQDVKEWESATLGLVVFDEPPPRDVYGASVARLRRGGKIAFFMTPLMAGGWIIDELVDGDSKTGIVYADLHDNCRDHSVRGTLSHDDITRMVEHMDPDEIEARVHGRAMHLSNVIYGKAFQRTVHIVPDDLQPPEGSQWGMVVDPARGKPWAIGWFWVDMTGQIVFDREYPEEDWTKCRETVMALPDYVELIHRAEGDRRTEWRILDRHFGNSRNDYGRTLKQDLSDKFGLDFQDSYNVEEEVESGILKVKDFLKVDPVMGPRLKVKARCRNIIRSFERWGRDGKTFKPRAESPYKDHADLVRYAVGAGLEVYWAPPLEPRRAGYVLGR